MILDQLSKPIIVITYVNNMQTIEVHDKNGQPIHVGDVVSAKARSGKHVGTVRNIVLTEEEATAIEDITVKNPPKVILQNEKGEHLVILDKKGATR